MTTDRVRSSVRKGPHGGEPGRQAGVDRPAVHRPAGPRPGRGRDRGPGRLREDRGTSSRLHPLQRPKFGELLTYARPGDTVRISEMFRLVRGNQHILDALDVLHRDRLALRIHDGVFSAMDLAAVEATKAAGVRTAYLEGRSIAAPRPRPPGQPWRDPDRRRRPPARAHRHRGGRAHL
ncbi:recombinase family protein [Streptomyces sp. NPDC003444]